MDTREYEWSDLTLILGGRDVTGFRAAKYTESQEKEVLYAKGAHGHSVQNGNISVEGSFTLLQSEVLALQAAAGGSILKIRNLTAVVAYGNPSEGTPMVTDTITGISFTEVPKELTQGDKFMEVEIPFVALRVKTA